MKNRKGNHRQKKEKTSGYRLGHRAQKIKFCNPPDCEQFQFYDPWFYKPTIEYLPVRLNFSPYSAMPWYLPQVVQLYPSRKHSDRLSKSPDHNNSTWVHRVLPVLRSVRFPQCRDTWLAMWVVPCGGISHRVPARTSHEYSQPLVLAHCGSLSVLAVAVCWYSMHQ